MRIVGMILPPEEPAYICPHCGKNYKSEAALEKHIKDKHPDAEAEAEAEQPEAADTEA